LSWFDVLHVDQKIVKEDFDFEFQIQLETGEIKYFPQQTDEGHQPGVGWLENFRFSAGFQYFSTEWNYSN